MLNRYEQYHNQWMRDLKRYQQVRNKKNAKFDPDPEVAAKNLEKLDLDEPCVTILDRVDQSPARTQVRSLVEHALNVNKQRMIGGDTLAWYCTLRQGEYDHAYDGINSNIKIRKNRGGHKNGDGQVRLSQVTRRSSTLEHDKRRDSAMNINESVMSQPTLDVSLASGDNAVMPEQYRFKIP